MSEAATAAHAAVAPEKKIGKAAPSAVSYTVILVAGPSAVVSKSRHVWRLSYAALQDKVFVPSVDH